MRKIVIQNFGPIKDAEINIKPITVLLGEQATGKSTVAQCIHLFLSLGEDFVRDMNLITLNRNVDYIEDAIVNIVRSKFYAYYGSSKYLDAFDVKFYFNIQEDKYIHIRPVKDKTIASFSKNFQLRSFCEDLAYFAEQNYSSFDQRLTKLRDLVATFLQITEGFDISLPKYFIAGRNITTAYSEAFKTFFAQNFGPTTRLKGRNIPKSAQMELTREFIFYSSVMKDMLSNFGGNFEELFDENQMPKAFKKDFIDRVTNILKGRYIISNGDELIRITYGKHIPLHFASSGQQESIRILQDLALQCAFVDDTFRTIEEPEAHLFPSAQNLLTELIVMTHNRAGSNFFLTTHSPYFLSSFNNLLYAAKAAGDNLAVNEIPNPEYVRQVEHIGYRNYLRLKANNFAAYQLRIGKSVESIFDPEKGITDIDGLDAVSIEISRKFEALTEIVKEAEEYETA